MPGGTKEKEVCLDNLEELDKLKENPKVAENVGLD